MLSGWISIPYRTRGLYWSLCTQISTWYQRERPWPWRECPGQHQAPWKLLLEPCVRSSTEDSQCSQDLRSRILCMFLPRCFLVWAPMQIIALSEAKRILVVLILPPSWKILPVNWCGTAKIKTHSANQLNKADLVYHWLAVCQSPEFNLTLYPEIGHGLHLQRRLFQNEYSCSHVLEELIPKYHEAS